MVPRRREKEIAQKTRNPQIIILERVSGIGDVKRVECLGATFLE
jgi:hypothetical protein